jgi:hypothetical protein
MREGIRAHRQRYVSNAHGGRTLDYYAGEKTADRCVFISFHIEDEAQVELLRQQAKNENSNISFIDYSIKEPFDEKWKTQAIERIKHSSVFICMIGPETYKRDAVNWEINKAYELGKKVIGVRIYKNENDKIPQPLLDHDAKIIDWNLGDIAAELEEE